MGLLVERSFGGLVEEGGLSYVLFYCVWYM
jgi:hypothetical protein